MYERNTELVRLLVSRGADEHHLSTFGWTALAYLWFHKDDEAQSHDPTRNLELLKVFTASGLCFDLTVRDVWGWNTLQRAVAEGTVEEINFILQLSDTPVDNKHRLNDSALDAIEHAIQLGDF
jgi:hypothetical protein